MHVVLRDTFIPYMHVDLRLFLNILVSKQVMMNEFMKQAKGLEKGSDFTYLKCDFKYVIERRARMITVKKGKKKRNWGLVGGQLVLLTSP